MDYTEIYINTFKQLWEVFIALIPLIAIAVLITILRAKSEQRKKEEKKAAQKTAYSKKRNESSKKQEVNKAADEKSAAPTESEKDYLETDYYKETKATYEEVISDKGRAGEYAAYRSLMNIAGYKRFLFDLYVPNGDKKTEMDIVLIHETGIYVVECKNFRGWIIGDETSEKWCQSFKNDKKYYFYNPIKQNFRHIQYLREYIAKDIDIESIIVFGNEATLKNITNTNKNLRVINNYDLEKTINEKINSKEKTLTQDKIDNLYEELKKMQW